MAFGAISSLLFLLSVIFNEIPSCEGAEWSYDDHHHGDTGPSSWTKLYPTCGNSSQSPIDIVLDKAIHSGDIPAITFDGYDTIPNNVNYSLANNGHTVQLSIAGSQLGVRGGGLPGDYRLVQFHVHWGGSAGVGSEHTIDGKSYPLEIHFVHFSKRFENIQSALADSQGLAVVGVFAEIGEKHPALDELIMKFSFVKYKGSSTNSITPFKMGDLLPTKHWEFIRYNGSLTTPQCQESVVWTVLKNPIKISQTQLNAFRALSHSLPTEPDLPLVDNFRPVQSIGSRSILRTFAVEVRPPPTKAPPPPSKKSGAYRPQLGVSFLALCLAFAQALL